jgi:hypothetical protein
MQIHPKPGLHDVYIARDKVKMWFKIGMTGNDLENRRKAICRHEYDRRSYDKIDILDSWQFQDFFAALYLERATIALIKRFGFKQVRPQDWFEIDKPTMDVFRSTIYDIAYDIREWEKDNFGLECDCLRPNLRWDKDRPYCARAIKIGCEELSRRAQAGVGKSP